MARDLADESPEDKYIVIPDPVILKDLATALGQKPNVIVVEALQNHYFVNVNQGLDFGMAARIAEKYGFHARRLVE